jgi:hypothetical protein
VQCHLAIQKDNKLPSKYLLGNILRATNNFQKLRQFFKSLKYLQKLQIFVNEYDVNDFSSTASNILFVFVNKFIYKKVVPKSLMTRLMS